MANFTIDDLPNMRFPWYGRLQMELWIPLKQFVYERDKGICQYCGKSTEYIDTHCHHILELSEHGTNHPSNLKTLCKECHELRHPFMMDAIKKLEARVLSGEE